MPNQKYLSLLVISVIAILLCVPVAIVRAGEPLFITTQSSVILDAAEDYQAYLPLINTPAITSYSAADGGVTIKVPEGNRYIIIGDSLGYGSQFLGTNTFEDICIDRWPFSEQLSVETGIMTTANLDRGHSILSPFLIQIVDGHVVEYCNPSPNDPKSNTIVPGSFTREWVSQLRFDSTVQQELNNPGNPVVLILIGADIFAEKIDKPVVTVEEYIQNLGQLVIYFSSFNKITYIAHFPHVRVGSFIASGELEAYNDSIDIFNTAIDEMISMNGYFDSETNQFIDFGQFTFDVDGLRLWVNNVQAGPFLDQLSDTFPDDYYAKDGLHYHAVGYDIFGSAWANSLKAPLVVNQAEWIP